MSDSTTDLPCASHVDIGADHALWIGWANGQQARVILTKDVSELFVRGVITQAAVGVELVDAAGNVRACSFSARAWELL